MPASQRHRKRSPGTAVGLDSLMRWRCLTRNSWACVSHPSQPECRWQWSDRPDGYAHLHAYAPLDLMGAMLCTIDFSLRSRHSVRWSNRRLAALSESVVPSPLALRFVHRNARRLLPLAYRHILARSLCPSKVSELEFARPPPLLSGSTALVGAPDPSAVRRISSCSLYCLAKPASSQ